MNIKLCYLYRDAANYKRYSEVIFSNQSKLSITDIEQIVCSLLIDCEWFCADKWHLPDLHFVNWDGLIDHDLNEFHSIEETDEHTTSGDIRDFLNQIRHGEQN